MSSTQLMRLSAQLATDRARRWREDFQAFSDQDPSYAPEYLPSPTHARIHALALSNPLKQQRVPNCRPHKFTRLM